MTYRICCLLYIYKKNVGTQPRQLKWRDPKGYKNSEPSSSSTFEMARSYMTQKFLPAQLILPFGLKSYYKDLKTRMSHVSIF